jgi:hypothetical protein
MFHHGIGNWCFGKAARQTPPLNLADLRDQIQNRLLPQRRSARAVVETWSITSPNIRCATQVPSMAPAT